MCKKIFLLISIMFLLGLAGNTQAALVGYWSFDDQTADDSSGNGHDGTLTGNAAIVNDATRGYVLSLDGAGDYVNLGSGTWTNPGNHVTVAAWIKVANFDAAYQAVVAKGNSTYRLHRNNTNNGMACHMNYTSSSYKAVYGSTSVNDGNWHHAVMTYDGTNLKLYVDGQSNGTIALSTLYTTTANLCIGRNVDQTTRDWEGQIDDVRIYDTALTETEIRALAGWTCTISGSVGTEDGVMINGMPDETITSGGAYTATVGYGWSGTAIPEKEGYIFSPENITYSNVTANQTTQNYTPTRVTADDPAPADGAEDISMDQNLSWTSGALAAAVDGQAVYFGTSFDLVNSRDASVFIGYQDGTSFDPGTLTSQTTYYWAIDTINDAYPDSPWIGQVWSFSTVNTELVGYWRLNEGTGTIATDTSGFGNNGTITGAAWVSDGVMGDVLEFDGADYITIPSAAFSSISSQVTIALWQYGDAAIQPQNNSVFEGTKSGTSRVLNAHVPWGTGSIFFDAGYATTYDRISKAADYASQYEGQWNHWAFTKNTDTGEMKIYLNGALWLSGTGKTKSMTGITSFKIGSAADGTSNYDGMICEFRLYNVELSGEQINALVGQNTASNPSPVHRYIDVDPSPTLNWTAGALAAGTDGHDLYFGTDLTLVTNRDASVHIGLLDTPSYSPGMLQLATTYYWAVDEVNGSIPGSPWAGQVWRFSVRNSTEGYYKDLFLDGGAGLTGYKAGDIPAVGLLGYTNEHIDSGNVTLTRKIMLSTNEGSWIDDNGVLLYPDGEPRFRMIYVNGGSSGTHLDNLDPEGTVRLQTYVDNGGDYTGSCAGAWLSGPSKWGVAPTHLETVGLGTTYTDGIIPDGITPREIYFQGQWIPAVQLPISPLLRQNYNPTLFNDLKLHGLYQNGGCRVDPRRTMYGGQVSWDKERNEALVLFDMTWTLKDVAGAQPRNLLTDPNTTETWKMDHNNCMTWSYKGSDTSGKVVPCGSHPEHRQVYGEETPLQSAIYQYAYSGFGKATVKAALADGVARQMNDNATVGHEKIGDKQYHHFTITVPQGATQLQIVLDGNLYDMNLYAKNGDFAFMGEANVVAAANGTGSDETLTINNPSAGTWYIGVKCNDKVTSTYGGTNYTYTGKFEMLNGIAYTITATVTE